METKDVVAPVSVIRTAVKAFCAAAIVSTSLVWASVGGSVSGTVRDPQGNVVRHADVTAHESSTGLSYSTHTDSAGHYVLPVLPVGSYELDVAAAGFEGYQRTGIVLDTSAALTLDAALQLGSVSQVVP